MNPANNNENEGNFQQDNLLEALPDMPPDMVAMPSTPPKAYRPGYETLKAIAMRQYELSQTNLDLKDQLSKQDWTITQLRAAHKGLVRTVELLQAEVERLKANQADYGYFAPKGFRVVGEIPEYPRRSWWKFWTWGK